jgi:WbqC-like protein family
VTDGEKRIAIVQSNYIPWRGYFDLIDSVDEFVLLDDAQYTKRDWRNRNRIKTAQGTRWLSIAVQVSGRFTQRICDTRVADERWATSHWLTIRQAYAKAPHFEAEAPLIEELLATASSPLLSEINRHLLSGLCDRLGITTPLTPSMELDPQGTKSERLLNICLKTNGTTYVSGPAARAYLDEERFRQQGVNVAWFEYGLYPEYDQVHPPFDGHVSVVDLLLCAGPAAPALIKARSTEGASP